MIARIIRRTDDDAQVSLRTVHIPTWMMRARRSWLRGRNAKNLTS